MIPTENKKSAFDKIESVDELKSAKDFIIAKYDLQADVEIGVSGSFRRKAGEYDPVKEKIRISQYLLDNHSERVFRILKHELAHAEVSEHFKDFKPHGEEWKSMMMKLGIVDPTACHDLKLTDYNYVIRCSNPDCCMEIGRFKKSKVVKKPQLYRCKNCGNKLVSSKN